MICVLLPPLIVLVRYWNRSSRSAARGPMAFIRKGGPTLTSSDLKFQGFPVRPLCVICRLPKLALESLGITWCCKSDKLPQKVGDASKYSWYFTHNATRAAARGVSSARQKWDDYFPPLLGVSSDRRGSVSSWNTERALIIDHNSGNVTSRLFSFCAPESCTGGANLLTQRSSCCETDREIGRSYRCRAPGDTEVRYKPRPHLKSL